jgi:hypothetical protein
VNTSVAAIALLVLTLQPMRSVMKQRNYPHAPIQHKFKSGKGIETFSWRVKGDRAELVGYYSNSTDLLTR